MKEAMPTQINDTNDSEVKRCSSPPDTNASDVSEEEMNCIAKENKQMSPTTSGVARSVDVDTTVAVVDDSNTSTSSKHDEISAQPLTPLDNDGKELQDQKQLDLNSNITSTPVASTTHLETIEKVIPTTSDRKFVQFLEVEANRTSSFGSFQEMKSKLPKSSPSLSTTSSAEKADEQQRNVVVQDDDDEKKEEVATPPIVGTPPGMHNSPRMQPLPISPITLRMESEQQQPSQQQTDGNHPNNNVMTSPSRVRYASPPGRRTIQLRLLEEVPEQQHVQPSYSFDTPFKKNFAALRRFRSLSLTTVMVPPIDEKSSSTSLNGDESNMEAAFSVIDRGTITVSWYEGTTSSEMHDHVWNCVVRKLNSSLKYDRKEGKIQLEDVRLLDENVTPHEGTLVGCLVRRHVLCMSLNVSNIILRLPTEVVLCPFLPDGSQFLLKFRTSIEQTTPKIVQTRHDIHQRPPYASRAPDSPSAEPSPYQSSLNLTAMNGMNNAQLQLLNAANAVLQSNGIRPHHHSWNVNAAAAAAASTQIKGHLIPRVPILPNVETVPKGFPDAKTGETSPNSSENAKSLEDAPVESSTDQLIEQQLRQLNELFMLRKGEANTTNDNNTQGNEISDEDDQVKAYKFEEKKQVIFVIANYLVLFLSLIAMSAEIQSRLPRWMNWVQGHYDTVQNCATDRDALFECVSEGNFSGLVASFILWATQSASAKRIFLFGFESPKKLWTVVYEALVTAVCWGTSYIFIRRGLNPNTREKFIEKYWKDAVYGSLAGFNAAFMKAVLKNLVPHDVALEALETRQLRIFNWLGMLMSDE